MKKTTLAFIIATTFLVSACKGNDPISQHPSGGDGNLLKRGTTVKFDILTDPAFPTLVTPTYMAMDQKDRTLNVEHLSKNPVSEQDPLFAMGQTDGWSTTAPIEIEFTGKALDPVHSPNSFYLFKSGDPAHPSDTTIPTQLREGIDYYIKISQNKLEAILLKPLSPSSHYMFAVTDELKNIEGHPVGMSPSYAQLKNTSPQPSSDLSSLHIITQKIENTLESTGIDKSRIIFSTWFTTTSVGDVLYGAKLATAWAIKNGAQTVWKDSAIAQGISPAQLDGLYTLTPPVENTTILLKNAIVYDGVISLPYFLDIREDKYLTTPWQSAMPSVAKIHFTMTQGAQADKDALQNQFIALGFLPKDITLAIKNNHLPADLMKALTGARLTLANGERLDLKRNISRYNPVPTLKSIENIEYTLILPKTPECQTDKSNPVTVYMHGITSNKDSLLKSTLIDKLMEGKCQAVVTINHPLHGARGINNKNASTDPTMYLNLDSFRVGRDNIRQSTIDVINLRASLGALFKKMTATPEILPSLGALSRLNPLAPVSFAGHSLGAMTGINVRGLSDRSIGNADIDKALFTFEKFAFANPGAGIPYMLFNSKSFQSLIKSKIYAASNSHFIIQCGSWPLPVCYGMYEKKLINEGSPASLEKLKNIYALFNQSAYMAQTIFDTVDPINHSLSLSTTPVYLTQVKGDMIIPNFIPKDAVLPGTDISQPYLAFAGTAPLIKSFSLTVTSQSIQNKPVKNAVLFNKGSHSSLLGSESKSTVSKEMQLQLQSFLKGNGETLLIENTSILEPNE